MTHQSHIAIPARFVFRPFRAQWVMCWAEIVGWGEESLGRLKALIGHIEERRVKVRLAIPRESNASESAIGILGGLSGRSYDTYDVEIKRSDVPPDCLQPHETPDNTPDISGREIELLVCGSPEPGGIGFYRKPEEIIRDAWDMRDQFFALEEDIYATRQFLNRWGLWNFEPLYGSGSLKMHPFVLVSPHRLWTMRDTYIKAAAGSPRAWLSTATPLSLKETEKIPYFIVERFYCEDAIKATITIDHLSNVKFGICKRHDCRRFFRRTTLQKRMYCSSECAHLANVRKLRKEKKKAELKGRKHASRKS